MADSENAPKKLDGNVVFYSVPKGNRFIAPLDSEQEAVEALRVLTAAKANPNHKVGSDDTHYISVREDREQNLRAVITTPIPDKPLISPKHLASFAEAFDMDKPITAVGAVVPTSNQALREATHESGRGGISQ